MNKSNAEKKKSLVSQMFAKPVDKEKLLKKSAEQKSAGRATHQRSSGAVQAMSKSLTSIEETNKRLTELIATGRQAVELDTDLLDSSFIQDRFEIDDAPEFQDIKRSIESNGQQVPILVRPHPTVSGRYQVAYGHRRWRACKALGRKVLSIVRDLTDSELILAQGQENHERQDLSYIETAYLCAQLNERFPQNEIAAAIGKSKTTVSLLLKLTRSLPSRELMVRIGAASSVGRPRWEEFAEYWKRSDVQVAVENYLTSIEGHSFEDLPSDERFKKVLSIAKQLVNSSRKAVEPANYLGPDKAVKIRSNNNKLTIEVNSDRQPELAALVNEQVAKIVNQYFGDQKMQED